MKPPKGCFFELVILKLEKIKLKPRKGGSIGGFSTLGHNSVYIYIKRHNSIYIYTCMYIWRRILRSTQQKTKNFSFFILHIKIYFFSAYLLKIIFFYYIIKKSKIIIWQKIKKYMQNFILFLLLLLVFFLYLKERKKNKFFKYNIN